jgi:hypothetical protein
MGAGAGTLSRGLPLRLATGLLLASVATVLVASIWTADRGPEPDSGTGPDLIRVGVVEGQSVPGYLRSSQGELAALLRGSAPATPTWALVSLNAYFPPDRLMSVLGGVAVAQVYARAQVPGTITQVVRIPVYRMPDDVVNGMLSAAAGRDRERADYQQLGAELRGGGEDELRLRRAYESAERTAADEAAAYRARCSCVFAAVVRAAPIALEGIAGHAECVPSTPPRRFAVWTAPSSGRRCLSCARRSPTSHRSRRHPHRPPHRLLPRARLRRYPRRPGPM